MGEERWEGGKEGGEEGGGGRIADIGLAYERLRYSTSNLSQTRGEKKTKNKANDQILNDDRK